jgi:hypothetical protein
VGETLVKEAFVWQGELQNDFFYGGAGRFLAIEKIVNCG